MTAMTDINRERPLLGRRIMLVEDEPILALDVALTLEDAGAEVAGPFHRLETALACHDAALMHGAVLDVDLAGREAFALAVRLSEAGVPILFHTARTGIDPRRYGRARVCQKPYAAYRLVSALTRLIEADAHDRRAVTQDAAAR